MTRDISETTFEKKLAKYDITIPDYTFLGYVRMPNGTMVSYLNANSNRWRTRLAYLLKERSKHL